MNWFRSLVSLIFFFSAGAIAQAQGCFSADVTEGCVPLTINLTDCSGGTGIVYNYGETATYEATTSHTYNSAGTYTLQQITTVSGTPYLYTRTSYIRVVDPVVPVFSYYLCQGFRLYMDLNNAYYPQYQIDFGDGSPPVLANAGTGVTHIYANGTTRAVTVTGMFNGTQACGNTSFSVTPQASALAPSWQGIIYSGTEAILRFTGSAHGVYIIEHGTGSTTPTDTLTGQTNYIDTISGLDASQPHCFRVRQYDFCLATSQSTPVLCSPKLDITVNNSFNTLDVDYSASGAGDSVVVYKNSAVLSSYIPAELPDDYTDSAVVCGAVYCYQATLFLGGVSLISSLEYCVTAQSTTLPPAPGNAQSTYTFLGGNDITLTWDGYAGTEKEVTINTRRNNAPGETLSAQGSPYVYPSDPRRYAYCFTLRRTDSCNNVSATTTQTCPVRLTSRGNDDYTFTLEWTAYTGWGGLAATNYELQWLDEAGNVIKTLDVTSQQSYTTSQIDSTGQILRFRIAASRPATDGFVSYSNLMVLKQEVRFFFAEAFTPNGDAFNDEYYPGVYFMKEYTVTIYNNWGDPVYSFDKDGAPWIGYTENGAACPQGSYLYIATGTDESGAAVVRRGTFLLIRDK